MFFDLREGGALRLFDGDKIAALLAGFVRELLEAAGLGALRLLAVQTAYANGASTGCIRAAGAEARRPRRHVVARAPVFRHWCSRRAERHVFRRTCPPPRVPPPPQVALAKTGVKFLHEVAERADVGCYFEANGHGTLLFSPAALGAIREARDTAPRSPSTPTGAACRLRRGNLRWPGGSAVLF